MDVRGWYTYKSEEFYQDDGQKRNTYEAMGQLSGVPDKSAYFPLPAVYIFFSYDFPFYKSRKKA